jgi:hypothetical protein
MTKGRESFEFEFKLCDQIPILCVALIRFGIVYHITAYWEGNQLDISDYLFDEQFDFITLEAHLKHEGQELYEKEKGKV